MAKRVILVRHGILAEAHRGRYIGRTDAPLSAEGRRQAAALAPEFGRWEKATILCSPLLRCRETATIALGDGQGFRIDEELREIDFGRWEGLGFAEIAAADPATVDRWAALVPDFTFPGGEALRAFTARIAAAAARIAADPMETVIVVAHGGVIRFLICRFLGLEDRHYLLFGIGPGSVTELRIAEGSGILTRLAAAQPQEGL